MYINILDGLTVVCEILQFREDISACRKLGQFMVTTDEAPPRTAPTWLGISPELLPNSINKQQPPRVSPTVQ